MTGVQTEIRTGYLLKLSHLFDFVLFVIITILQHVLFRTSYNYCYTHVAARSHASDALEVNGHN